jgi:hypothetical protein
LLSKISLPATKISVPAAAASTIVALWMPPSIETNRPGGKRNLTGGGALLLDPFEQVLRLGHSLDVDDDRIAPGLEVIVEVPGGIQDHQMSLGSPSRPNAGAWRRRIPGIEVASR